MQQNLETNLRVVSTRFPQDEPQTPAEVAHGMLRQSAAHGYDQGYAAGSRTSEHRIARAFDAGVGVGAICGLAIGIVFTVFLAPIIAAVLS